MYVCMSESLYAYYNPVLIQRINFLNMYVCMSVTSARASMRLCVHLCVCVRVFVVVTCVRLGARVCLHTFILMYA